MGVLLIFAFNCQSAPIPLSLRLALGQSSALLCFFLAHPPQGKETSVYKLSESSFFDAVALKEDDVGDNRNMLETNQATLHKARQLRREMTDTERLLWSKIRMQQIGMRFRRQVPVGYYIVDFYCYEYRLVVELDGGHHSLPEQAAYDAVRTEFLEAQGLKILRFWNNDVIQQIDSVLQRILAVKDSFP